MFYFESMQICKERTKKLEGNIFIVCFALHLSLIF